MILDSLYALIATLAFSFLFNIRGKNIIFTALGGGIGWFFYLLSLKFELSVTFALFIASISISLYSEIMCRTLKTPVTTFIICAILPLVPGNGMYYTMFESISGNFTKSLTIGFQTIINAGSIALAIVLVSSTTKLFLMRKNLFKVKK